MHELAGTATDTATPLASHLWRKPAQPEPHPQLMQLYGVATLSRFTGPEVELDTLLRHAAVHDLGWLARIRVTGEDRLRWLSGMVTNAVQQLEEGQGNYSFLLNAQGRIQGDLTVWHQSDSLILETTAAQLPQVFAHLDHYIIMDDVELTAVEGETTVGISGPEAAQALAAAGIDAAGLSAGAFRQLVWQNHKITLTLQQPAEIPHYELWIPVSAVAPLVAAFQAANISFAGAEALEQLRIYEGIPAYGTDIFDKDLPQETAQERALYFNKGCYIGQEIVERIRSRGQVHRRLTQVRLEGSLPAPGAPLLQGEKEIGRITSAAELTLRDGTRILGLANLRTEALIRKEPLMYEGGRAFPIQDRTQE